MLLRHGHVLEILTTAAAAVCRYQAAATCTPKLLVHTPSSSASIIVVLPEVLGTSVTCKINTQNQKLGLGQLSDMQRYRA